MAEKLVLYVLTDTHYISEKMWEEGDPINNREKGDQIAIKSTPQILRTFIEKILADDEAKHVLITGDLINSGDKQSHLDFIQELKPLTDAGKHVYVTTATHDYAGEGEDGDENIFHATYYGKDECRPAERVGKKDLLPLYYDFGPAQSDSVHETGSYSLPIQEGYRLIAINDNGNGRSHCGLFEDGMQWLSDEIDRANAAGETVLTAVHHPVISPWPIYSHLVEFEMYGGYKELSRLLCEKGVRVIFTGHTHVQNIQKYTDEQGRFFYDVSTTAMSTPEGKMRKIVFDPETKTLHVTSIGIETIKGLDTHGKSAKDYIYSLNFIGLLENALPDLKTDWNKFVDGVRGLLPTDKLQAHPKLWKTGLSAVNNLKMSLPAKFGKRYNGLSRAEIRDLKQMPLLPEVIAVVRRVFAGNGPFPPETVQYKVFTGVTQRVDHIQERLHIKKLAALLPEGQTLTDVLLPFLYNNRTGDDDAITIDL